jgi:predicted nucleic acid-binding protein
MRVFVDTSAVLPTSDRLPLLICAQEDALDVYWSPFIAAEVARVATRRHVEATLRQLREQLRVGETSGDVVRPVLDAMENVRVAIDHVIAVHQRWWSSPDPHAVARLEADLAHEQLPDDNDRPVLACALAADCDVLLSRDREMFQHGHRFGRSVCWHPDTFLTALFQGDRQLYDLVRMQLRRLGTTANLLP